jgi:hypothetical protein
MNAPKLTTSAILLLMACNSITRDETRGFVTGTYVRVSDQEMRREYDTIKIDLVSEAGNNYSVIRSLSFQRKMDREEFAWQYKKENWVAVYDESKRILYETRKGKIISFAPEKHTLFVGSTEYKKIN